MFQMTTMLPGQATATSKSFEDWIAKMWCARGSRPPHLSASLAECKMRRVRKQRKKELEEHHSGALSMEAEVQAGQDRLAANIMAVCTMLATVQHGIATTRQGPRAAVQGHRLW